MKGQISHLRLEDLSGDFNDFLVAAATGKTPRHLLKKKYWQWSPQTLVSQVLNTRKARLRANRLPPTSIVFLDATTYAGDDLTLRDKFELETVIVEIPATAAALNFRPISKTDRAPIPYCEDEALAAELSKGLCCAVMCAGPEQIWRYCKSQRRPMLTIVIPAIGDPPLVEALQSILRQEGRPDIEVLVIDGGLGQSARQDARKYSRRYSFIHWIRVRDRSPYDAMNLATALARSEWIYFLGADDSLFHQKTLHKLLHHLSEQCNSKSLIYGNVFIVGSGPGAENGDTYDGRFTYEKLHKKNICHQAIVYRTKAIQEVGGFNGRYSVNADWDLNLRLWERSPGAYYDATIANFVRGGLSTTKIDIPFFKDLETRVAELSD